MGDYRVAERPLDPDAVAAADAAVAPETGGRPLRMDETELRAKWIDAYEKAGGKVRTIESNGSKTDDTCETCPKKKKLILKVVQLEVLSDHNVLKDNTTDWKNTGKVYKTPDWTPTSSNPISHSMSKKIKLKVFVEAEKQGSAEEGKLVGKLAGNVLVVSKKTTFKPGKRTEVVMESTTEMNDLIQNADISIDWEVATKKSYTAWTNIGTTFNDPWFVTFDKPIEGKVREDGPTHKRMESAVLWVGHEKTVKHSKILHYMFSQFDRYVLGVSQLSEDEQAELEADPDLKKQLGDVDWPTYFNDAFGAWPIPDYHKWGAECQAICRMVLGMLRQVGSKQDVKLVYISGDFSDPEKPKEQTKPTGPDKTKRYALVDAPIEVGRTYWPPKPGEREEVGWNNFEAYLKYNFKGYLRWYGGGVGLLPDGANPLTVFQALAEFEVVSREVSVGDQKKTEYGRKITRAHFYR